MLVFIFNFYSILFISFSQFSLVCQQSFDHHLEINQLYDVLQPQKYFTHFLVIIIIRYCLAAVYLWGRWVLFCIYWGLGSTICLLNWFIDWTLMIIKLKSSDKNRTRVLFIIILKMRLTWIFPTWWLPLGHRGLTVALTDSPTYGSMPKSPFCSVITLGHFLLIYSSTQNFQTFLTTLLHLTMIYCVTWTQFYTHLWIKSRQNANKSVSTRHQCQQTISNIYNKLCNHLFYFLLGTIYHNRYNSSKLNLV